MSSRHARKGFTLIELIVVIVVLGILAAIAIVGYNAVIERSELETALAQDNSLVRETAALWTFDPTLSPEEPLTEAVADLPGAALPAAPTDGFHVVAADSTTQDEYSWSLFDNSTSATTDDFLFTLRFYDADTGIACWAQHPDAGPNAGCRAVPVPSAAAFDASALTPSVIETGVAGFSTTTTAPAVGLSVGYGSPTLSFNASTLSFSPTVTGAAAPTFSVAGTLPGGVSFNTSTGDFTATGPFNTTYTQVVSGEHTCALTSTGVVECWGANYDGQLGDGTSGGATTAPSTVLGLSGDVVTEITNGWAHSCALIDDGTVKCWGANYSGQLGDGTFVDATSAVTVSGISTAVSIAGADSHTCALLADSSVRCWGAGSDGELGNGANSDSNVPVAVSGLTDAVILEAGDYSTCVIRTGGVLSCWGGNVAGQLGTGDQVARNVPTVVTAVSAQTIVDVTVATRHTCVVNSLGTASCWGQGVDGQLGNGANTLTLTPVAVSGLTGIEDISAGYFHTCALLDTGAVSCWGSNTNLQLGTGSATPTSSNVPLTVAGLGGFTVTEISNNALSTCLLTDVGEIVCWGYNEDGGLGDGTYDNSPTPTVLAGSGPTAGFPSTVTVTVTDGPSSADVTVDLLG